MARSPSEATAVSRSKALLAAEVQSGGGGDVYRVVIDHPDSDHDVLPVAAHFGPAYNAAWAETVAQVKGVSVGDVDLLEEAKMGARRARAEYPEPHIVAIETLVVEGDSAKWRRVEG